MNNDLSIKVKFKHSSTYPPSKHSNVAATSVDAISDMLKGRGIIDSACSGYYFQKSVIHSGKLKNIENG